MNPVFSSETWAQATGPRNPRALLRASELPDETISLVASIFPDLGDALRQTKETRKDHISSVLQDPKKEKLNKGLDKAAKEKVKVDANAEKQAAREAAKAAKEIEKVKATKIRALRTRAGDAIKKEMPHYTSDTIDFTFPSGVCAIFKEWEEVCDVFLSPNGLPYPEKERINNGYQETFRVNYRELCSTVGVTKIRRSFHAQGRPRSGVC